MKARFLPGLFLSLSLLFLTVNPAYAAPKNHPFFTTVSKVQAMIDGSLSGLSNILSELKLLNDEVDANQTVLSNIESRVAGLEAKTSNLPDAFTSLISRVDILAGDMANLTTTISSLTGRVDLLENESGDQAGAIGDLQTRVDGHDQELTVIDSRLDGHDQELDNLQSQINALPGGSGAAPTLHLVSNDGQDLGLYMTGDLSSPEGALVFQPGTDLFVRFKEDAPGSIKRNTIYYEWEYCMGTAYADVSDFSTYEIVSPGPDYYFVATPGSPTRSMQPLYFRGMAPGDTFVRCHPIHPDNRETMTVVEVTATHPDFSEPFGLPVRYQMR